MLAANSIIKNSVALWGSQAFHSLVSLGAIAIIARYLGIERFGEYGFVLAVCNIFQVMIDMGANQILIREVARRRETVSEYFSANVVIMVVFGTMVFSLILGTVYAFKPGKDVLLAAGIGACAVIALFVSQLFGAVFQAFEKMEFVAFMRSMSYVVYFGLVVLVVLVDGGIVGIFSALLVQQMSACLAGYLFTRKHFFVPKFELNGAKIRDVLLEAWPVGANAMLRKLTYRADIVLLKCMAAPADLGLFNGIYRIILQLQFIPRNVTSALYPVFSRFAGDGSASVAEVHSRSAKFLFVGCVPLIGLLLVFPAEMISLVLGEPFVQAVPLMRLLSGALAAMFFSTLFLKMLTAANRQRKAALSVAVSLAVNVVLAVILIPSKGFIGAGIATLIAEIVLLIMSGAWVFRYLVIRSLVRSGVKLSVAGVGMALVWLGFGTGANWFTFVAGGLCYPFLLWGFHVFDDQESIWITDNMKRLFKGLAKV